MFNKPSEYLKIRAKNLDEARKAAICTGSNLGYRARYGRFRWWTHTFEDLATQKKVSFRVKHRTMCDKVLKLLCKTGRIGKKKCDSCPAKYFCYTMKRTKKRA